MSDNQTFAFGLPGRKYEERKGTTNDYNNASKVTIEQIDSALESNEGRNQEFAGTIASEEDLFKASRNDQGNFFGDGEIHLVRSDGKKYKVNARELWIRYQERQKAYEQLIKQAFSKT